MKMKIKKDELEQLRRVKQNLNQITFDLGLIAVNKMNLSRREEALKKDWDNMKDVERTVIEELEKKYGRGSVDIDTGYFVAEGDTETEEIQKPGK